MNSVLSHQLDLIGFMVVVALIASTIHVLIRRRGARGMTGKNFLVIAPLLVTGVSIAWISGESERSRLQRAISGLAPTYAAELVRIGHAGISPATPADDPTYLALIEAEKRWLAANPIVADIYTFTRNRDGKIVLLVDSETDYNHNGKIDEEREERTAIGEEYEEESKEMTSALQGNPAFESTPVVDRWGTWVTATEPLFDEHGKLIGAVGVDFDAGQWVSLILLHRLGVLAFTAAVLVVVVAAGVVVQLMSAEVDLRRSTELRLRTILDNEPESVAVVSTTGEWKELNPSGFAFLEWTLASTLPSKPLLDFAHPADRGKVEAHLQTVGAGQAARVQYRLIGTRGGEKWVDAHSVPLTTKNADSYDILTVCRDITAQRTAETERESLHRKLVDASRVAGMAEVATGVLHNVGNVLNSLNINVQTMEQAARQSKLPNATRALQMIGDHEHDLAEFINNDSRGRQLPAYLSKLAPVLLSEQEEILSLVRQISQGLEHVKEIVRSQQSMAGTSVLIEQVRPQALIEDAIKLNITSCERHQVQIDYRSDEMPMVTVDRHKVLQILVNLISNAKAAVKEQSGEKRISILLRKGTYRGENSMRFEVTDNGYGMSAETQAKLFQHGFTTKSDGHGFGLHSAINFARELGGTMSATSDGPGRGSTFVLELPMAYTAAALRGAA